MFRTSIEDTNIYKKLQLVRREIVAEGLTKDGSNPAYKNHRGKASAYLTLDSLMETLNPILDKHNLLLLQPLSSEDGKLTLTTLLRDMDSQEWATTTTTWPSLGSDPQKTAGATTYGRRYDLVSLLALIADKDDDGNTASGVEKTPVVPTSNTGKAFVSGGFKKTA